MLEPVTVYFSRTWGWSVLGADEVTCSVVGTVVLVVVVVVAAAA
jgi:flagellin-like protein